MTVIGIDPDRGFAIAIDGELKSIRTCKNMVELKETIKTNLQFLRFVEQWDSRTDRIRVEKPHGIGTRMGRGMPLNVVRKIAANVGQSYQKSEEIYRYCRELGETNVEYVAGCKKFTKLSHEAFCRITGWDPNQRTSSHGRDAAILAKLS